MSSYYGFSTLSPAPSAYDVRESFSPAHSRNSSAGLSVYEDDRRSRSGTRRMQTTVAIRDVSPHRFKVLPLKKVPRREEPASIPAQRIDWAAKLKKVHKKSASSSSSFCSPMFPVYQSSEICYDFHQRAESEESRFGGSVQYQSVSDDLIERKSVKSHLAYDDSAQDLLHSTLEDTKIKSSAEHPTQLDKADPPMTTSYLGLAFDDGNYPDWRNDDCTIEAIEDDPVPVPSFPPSASHLSFVPSVSSTSRKFRSLATLEEFHGILTSLDEADLSLTQSRSQKFTDGRRATDGSLSGQYARKRHAIYAEPGIQIIYPPSLENNLDRHGDSEQQSSSSREDCHEESSFSGDETVMLPKVEISPSARSLNKPAQDVHEDGYLQAHHHPVVRPALGSVNVNIPRTKSAYPAAYAKASKSGKQPLLKSWEPLTAVVKDSQFLTVDGQDYEVDASGVVFRYHPIVEELIGQLDIAVNDWKHILI